MVATPATVWSVSASNLTSRWLSPPKGVNQATGQHHLDERYRGEHCDSALLSLIELSASSNLD